MLIIQNPFGTHVSATPLRPVIIQSTDRRIPLAAAVRCFRDPADWDASSLTDGLECWLPFIWCCRIAGQDGGSVRGLRQTGQHVEPDVPRQPSGGQRGHLLVPRPERHRRQSPPLLGRRPHRFPLRRRHSVAHQSADHHQPAAVPFGELHLLADGRRSCFRHRSRHQR